MREAKIGTATGKFFLGQSVIVKYRDRWIAIVGESHDDLKRAWNTLQNDSPGLPDLDISMIQQVAICDQKNVIF